MMQLSMDTCPVAVAHAFPVRTIGRESALTETADRPEIDLVHPLNNGLEHAKSPHVSQSAPMSCASASVPTRPGFPFTVMSSWEPGDGRVVVTAGLRRPSRTFQYQPRLSQRPMQFRPFRK